MFKRAEQIRQQQGISITKLCYKAGIKRKTYYEFKSGKNITINTLRKICKVLKIETINI